MGNTSANGVTVSTTTVPPLSMPVLTGATSDASIGTASANSVNATPAVATPHGGSISVSISSGGASGSGPATAGGSNSQRYRYQTEIQAMMYTFGDVRHPLSTTTLLVEDIVHAQILELLLKATAVTYRRGARAIAPEDLLFLIRHDANRSSRLKEFLSWKDVRKNAKPGGASGGGNGTTSAAPSGADDSALVAEIEEDARQMAADGPGVGGTGVGTGTAGRTMHIGPKRRQLGLFWDLAHALLADVAPADASEATQRQRETLRRLRQADLLTQSMSQAEYMEYSECRQASFTYKKARKFREWLTGGTTRPGGLCLATLAGGSARDLARLSDDTLEILGFLAYETVQRITEVSLAVKYEGETRRGGQESVSRSRPSPSATIGGIFQSTESASTSTNASASASASASSVSAGPGTKNPTEDASRSNMASRKRGAGAMLSRDKTPIQPHHVEEAYRRLVTLTVDPVHLLRPGANRQRRLLL